MDKDSKDVGGDTHMKETNVDDPTIIHITHTHTHAYLAPVVMCERGYLLIPGGETGEPPEGGGGAHQSRGAARLQDGKLLNCLIYASQPWWTTAAPLWCPTTAVPPQ